MLASEAGGYIFTKEICPEKGLSAQGYKCAECHTRLTFSKLHFYTFLKKFRSIIKNYSIFK